MRLYRSLAPLFLTATVAGLAPAQAIAEAPALYVGGGAGASRFNHSASAFSDGSLHDVSVDDSDSGWKVFAGLRLSDRVAVEAAFVDLNNDFDRTTTLTAVSDGSGARFAAGPIAVDIDDPRLVTVAVVARLPLSSRTAFLARVGAARWEADRTLFSDARVTSESLSGIDAAIGAGLEMRLGGRTAVRLEWERFADVAGASIDLGSASLSIDIGRRR